MTGEIKKARSPRTWWRIALTVLFAAYLAGMWFLPETTFDLVSDAGIESYRPMQQADPTITDVFEIQRKSLWIPKRYEAKGEGFSRVVVQTFGPNLVSTAERGSAELDNIRIRFSSHMGGKHTSRAGAEALAGISLGSPENAPQWLPESGLYEFNDGVSNYYFSETYTAPSSEPFFIICEASSYGNSTPQSCRVGYLIYGVVFLEYSFIRHHSQEMVGWKELDLAVRRFALSALWRDGEMSSLEPTVGYDDEGRILRTVGSHTLHFPTRLTPRSWAIPGVSEFLQFRMCLSKEIEAAECPNYDENVRIFLQASKLQQMPNDGEEVLARTVRNYAYGPVALTGTNVEEFGYTEESPSRVYRMLDPDPSGRYPVVKCYSWCRSRFIVAPGLNATYDFNREHVTDWPQIDAAVRGQISDLLDPPPL